MQSEISGDIMIKLQWVQGNSWNVHECAFHISITIIYNMFSVKQLFFDIESPFHGTQELK